MKIPITFDDGRAKGHDGSNEQPSGLRSLPRDPAVLRRRAEQFLAHVEDELSPRVRYSERRQPEKTIRLRRSACLIIINLFSN